MFVPPQRGNSSAKIRSPDSLEGVPKNRRRGHKGKRKEIGKSNKEWSGVSFFFHSLTLAEQIQVVGLR